MLKFTAKPTWCEQNFADVNIEPFTQQEGPRILNFDPNEATAGQYFKLFIDLVFIDLLVNNTNPYAIWKQQQK